MLAGAAVETGTSEQPQLPGRRATSRSPAACRSASAYTLDGAMHNNPQNNANLPLPFPDALQEFRVATSGLSAQNGMHSGASVNAVTKSGTNTLHGNAFEFLRDQRFNATSPFAAIGPDGKRSDDGLKRNQFGGTLGGPIVHDKLFFFARYQGTQTRVRRRRTNIAFVPTAAMLAGDFTRSPRRRATPGRQVNLGAPFVNNRIDPARFSPAALNLAKRLPTTTDPCGQITVQSARRPRRRAVRRPRRLPAEREPLDVRPLHGDARQAAVGVRQDRQRPDDGQSGRSTTWRSRSRSATRRCSAATRSTRCGSRSTARPSTATTIRSSIPAISASTSTATCRAR